MSFEKKTRASYTASLKLKVIKRAKEANNSVAAREFSISEKLVRDWRKNEDKLQDMPKSKKALRFKATPFEEMEKDLNDWIMGCRESGYVVTRSSIQIRALQMVKENYSAAEDMVQFTASAGWCTRFMNRYGLCLRQPTKIAQKLPPKEHDEKDMESPSLIPSDTVKLEPDSETDSVEVSTEETPAEVQTCDEMESQAPAAIKIEKPEVYVDYPEIPSSSQIDPSASPHEHPHSEMYDNVNMEVVKQEPLCEDKNNSYSNMDDMASCSFQENTGESNAESTVTENGCKVSLKHETYQMSENIPSVIKISNTLFLKKKKLPNVDREFNRPNISPDSLNFSPGFSNSVPHGPQTGEMTSVGDSIVSIDTYLNRGKRMLAGGKPYKCDVCDASFSHSGHLKSHKRTHTGEKPYTCNVCGASFAQTSNLNSHKRTHTGEKPYKCVICSASFAQPGNLRIHERIHTGEKCYKCDECDASFMKARTLKNHKKTHTAVEEYFQCKVCNASFTQRSSLKSHKMLHAKEKRYKCDECDVSFARSDHLKYHKGKHTGEKPYKCDDCDASFRHASSLKCHKRKHTGEKPYACNECGAAFTQARGLNCHMTEHTGLKPYKCDVCEASFIRSHTLKSHMKIHTGEKKYKCDICGARFIESSTLKCHERIHTGERPYKCDDCGASFAQSSGLIVHKRTHTGERPYKCDFCDASFTESGTLKCHKRIHTGEKPYKCEDCIASFAQLSALICHKRTHTGEKPYKCDVCGASFVRSSYLKYHKKTHTGQ